MSNDDSTTISVSKDTRDRLDARKQTDDRFFQGEESFDHVIQRLLNDDGDAPAGDGADAADAEVRSALDTIESRTGRIEQAVEELTEGRR